MNSYQIMGLVVMICYPCVLLATSWGKIAGNQ